MARRTQNRIRYSMWVVVVYMLAALSWWSILLMKMNKENYDLKLIHSDPVLKTEAYDNYIKNQNMIFGEGIFFGLALIAGIYFIYRSYQKEIEISKRQNNFLLSVTHELKTPISVLSLTNQTLMKRELSKEQKMTILNDAGIELERLEDLVNNILTATKIDHNYGSELESISIRDFIEELVSKLRSRYTNPLQVEIETDYVIQADRSLMGIALKNLIDNACKYSPNNAVVRIKASFKNNQKSLSVIDSGIGINADESKKVFQKFYRSEDEQIRKSKGSGLGLFLVKEILNLFGATIELERSSNKGSTFKINFM